MKAVRWLVIALVLWGSCFGERAQAETLVADLSSELVAITSNFTGTELILFGALERDPLEVLGAIARPAQREATGRQERGDVVVVVRGPIEDVAVRRKGRMGLLWLNRDKLSFSNVPSFYFMATTRPLEQIAPQSLVQRQQLGMHNLNFEAGADTLFSPETVTLFREALVRNKENAGLYQENIGGVRFSGNTLFRTTLPIPANVPVGNYNAEVYLIRNGFIVSAQSWPFFVAKTGLERWLYRIAHGYPLLYGVGATVLALLAGGAASLILRRRI